MTRQIWKYAISGPVDSFEMPAGAQVLHVAMQGPQPCLWALVDTEAPKVERLFKTYGTGQDIPFAVKGDYIGSYQMAGLFQEPLIFHVFEVPE
jgi:hypothetical protein